MSDGKDVSVGGRDYHAHGAVKPEVSQGYALEKAQEIAWRAGKSISLVCGEVPPHLRDSVEFSCNFGLDGGEIVDFPGRPGKPSSDPSPPFLPRIGTRRNEVVVVVARAPA